MQAEQPRDETSDLLRAARIQVCDPLDNMWRLNVLQAQRDEELSKFHQKIAEMEGKLTASNQTKLLLTEQAPTLASFRCEFAG